MEKVGQRNCYICQECGGFIITENLDDGTTPFIIACKATKGCHGTMYSMFYNIPQDMPATYEWFKPKSMKGYSREMQEHFRLGGLDLRKRCPTQRQRHLAKE
jgi:hypothetical protein